MKSMVKVHEQRESRFSCKRCLVPINVLVPDSERTFINDGGELFCSKSCRTNYRLHIPLDPSRVGKTSKFRKLNEKRKHVESSKKKTQVIFKCFVCNNETTVMTHDKLCSRCSSRMYRENQERVSQGEKLQLIGGLTNEQRSQIRLSKMN